MRGSSPRPFRMGVLVTGVATLAVGILTPGSVGSYTVCENIAGQHVVTGESRYRTNPGTSNDSCYTNQYYDTGNELRLLCGYGPGALPSSDTTTYVMPAFVEDIATNDCDIVTFTYRLRDLSSFACNPQCVNQTAIFSHITTWVVDSCNPGTDCSGNSCLVFASKEMAFTHGIVSTSLFETWSDVSTPNGCNTGADSGCFTVATGLCDEVVDF